MVQTETGVGGGGEEENINTTNSRKGSTGLHRQAQKTKITKLCGEILLTGKWETLRD